MSARVSKEADVVSLVISLYNQVQDLMTVLQLRRHSIDFCSVRWDTHQFTFTPAQAKVVSILWEAMENDTPEVRQETLLEHASSQGSRLRDVFRDHPAFGAMIVPGELKGTFRLAPPAPRYVN